MYRAREGGGARGVPLWARGKGVCGDREMDVEPCQSGPGPSGFAGGPRRVVSEGTNLSATLTTVETNEERRWGETRAAVGVN